MKKNKLIPLFSGILLLTGCASKFDSEADAMAACEKWKSEEGKYTINLIMPPNSSSASRGVLQEIGNEIGDDTGLTAAFAISMSLGSDNDGVYKLKLTKRDCLNDASNYDGALADKFIITGTENKHFKSGQVYTLDHNDYSKFASGDYRFKKKDLTKFSIKVVELIEKRTDYQEVKEFEF